MQMCGSVSVRGQEPEQGCIGVAEGDLGNVVPGPSMYTVGLAFGGCNPSQVLLGPMGIKAKNSGLELNGREVLS